MKDPEQHESSPAAAPATATPASSPVPKEDEPPHSIFDPRQRALIVLIVSVAATFSGFASNIYFPALPTMASEFNVSAELINLSVTSYLVFQGLAPSFWAPLSDARGRRLAYACTFLVFLGACVGLALVRTYAGLIVLRCLQSAGSASTIAIGSGVVGDVTTRANRGGLMGIFQAGLLVPVAVGPVIGGALAGSLGWRSIFWFLTIYGGVFLILMLLLLPETLRAMVGNGSRAPSSLNFLARYPLRFYQKRSKIQWAAPAVEEEESTTATTKKKLRIDVLGPLRILASREAGFIVLFLAVYYAVWQMSITAMSTLFASEYGLAETQIGLTYIANGVGSMVGTLITGKILDADYRKVKKAGTAQAADGSEDLGDNLEKARLRLLPAFAALQCGSLLMFGWTIDRRVHIAAPIVSTFITGWTAVSMQSATMTYLVDVFHDRNRSAAASASLNLARCLCAAGGTSFVMPLVRALGTGVAFTVCVAAQAAALVLLFAQWRFGAQWRRAAADKALRKQELAAAAAAAEGSGFQEK